MSPGLYERKLCVVEGRAWRQVVAQLAVVQAAVAHGAHRIRHACARGNICASALLAK
jgi:hypothetical protein